MGSLCDVLREALSARIECDRNLAWEKYSPYHVDKSTMVK